MPASVSEAEFWIEFPDWANPENYALIPDELNLVMQRPEDDEPAVWTQLCLQGLLTLYNRLLLEESGACTGMFHANYIEVDAGRARLQGQPALVGTIEAFKETFRPLIADVLRELESEGIDSEAVCRNMRPSFEESPFDPVEIRAQLLH